MGVPFAEVIGDPIAQSKSPVIHRYWLGKLGIEADYLKTRVSPGDLAAFFRRRRADANWFGCNVTIPHKMAVIPNLDEVTKSAAQIGAVNCVERNVGYPSDRLIGHNTDVDGVAAALDGTDLEGRKVALIGAGGGARAVVAYVANRGVGRIAIVARNSERAEVLRSLASGADLEILTFDNAEEALAGAAVIINSSPLGMAGADSMPPSILNAVPRHAAGATVFDLVTTPAETAFLSAGRLGGGHPVDGLTMLVGQAARAFELFFGTPAPAADGELCDLLTNREEVK
jgi:shikimate dehydrogenase